MHIATPSFSSPTPPPQVIPQLSADRYAQMLPAAHRNFVKARSYLDPLEWMWRSGLNNSSLTASSTYDRTTPAAIPNPKPSPASAFSSQSTWEGRTGEPLSRALGQAGKGPHIALVVGVRDGVHDIFARKTLASILCQKMAYGRSRVQLILTLG